MSEPINITITNLPQIKAAFRMAPHLMLQELNKAIAKSIFSIGRQSRMNTPVDTGRLRASTYERFGNLQGEVGTNTSYDSFIHEGTRFMQGRPYLRKAVETNESNINGYFETSIQNVFDKIGDMT